MVECRTRPKKDGGKYKICYDEKPKAKPLAKAKPKPKLKVVEDVKPKAKPVAKAKPKPKLKVVEVVKPKVSEKAKAIIAAGKTTNRLEALPDDLINKIKQETIETVNARADRIFQNKILEDPYVDDLAERENEIKDNIYTDLYDYNKARKMTKSKEIDYQERIEEKSRKQTDAYTLKILRRIVKQNKNKSDKYIIEIFMKEL